MKKLLLLLTLIFLSSYTSKIEAKNYEEIIIEKLILTYSSLFSQITEMGIKFPRVVFTQALLETGHFKSELCVKHNNLFGMKKPSKRETTALGAVRHGYARYESWTKSVEDYLLWQNYVLKNKSIETESQYLNFIGHRYAQDPNYKRKLLKYIETYKNLMVTE